MPAPSQLALAVALFAAACLVLTSAYPSGAPKCSSLVPKHAKNKAQTGTAPYKVTTSAVTKDKDGKSTVMVTVAGTNDAKFKGFIVHASPANSSDKIGMFTKTDKTSVLSCGSSNAITHSDNTAKNKVTFTWTAPDNYKGNVEFKATVVKEFKEFWSGIKSPQVNIAK